MALSVVDLYAKVLPKTNCRDCGFPTCIAFAGMVVSEKHPLKNCPHIDADTLAWAEPELEAQYKEGKWLKKDMAAEALQLAKEKAASMALPDIAKRIGGTMEGDTLVLPYFDNSLHITQDNVTDSQGNELSRNEQTFVYIHMAMGGAKAPTGELKSFKEFPNTVSKIVSMNDHVETPLKKAFSGNPAALEQACTRFAGKNVKQTFESPDLAYEFQVFPQVATTLLFWDANAAEGFEADVKLLFDETVTAHLDIEAVMFMSEHLAKQLING